MSLTKKFVVIFLLVTLVRLGVIIWASHATLVGQAQEQIGARLEDGVTEASKSIDAFMFNSISSTKALLLTPI
jgi:hypothetical protein